MMRLSFSYEMTRLKLLHYDNIRNENYKNIDNIRKCNL